MIQDLEQLKKDLKYEKTTSCVQCGYCLPVCPTYATKRKETHSPRGRINLIKMVGEGRITDLSVLEEPLNICLACRACETACPTGVQYGEILEAARSVISRNKEASLPERILKNTLLNKIIPNPKAMSQIGNALWFYEKSGLQKVVRKSKILNIFPAHLGTFERIIPYAISPKERASLPKRLKIKESRLPESSINTSKHNNGESMKI
ncbi:4Fe-4S dicluster domain-containing protein [Neobacillus sp. PS3-12]|jgi:glycolate oxidase iron-sulfur subunit|uniref:(Fe-S)-binding protein n=1 Tax=Neobacillus sp. PS3-12 TaxID=3070677 RepID=UPI0027DFBE29|nr:4Fe-4S dicluster domain-containing protein [Neobacillus sp. PS3-12]WML50795.1 4Fe-4S dicluster domain-containing protein [Neobacillus sp. PS3-12]